MKKLYFPIMVVLALLPVLAIIAGGVNKFHYSWSANFFELAGDILSVLIVFVPSILLFVGVVKQIKRTLSQKFMDVSFVSSLAVGIMFIIFYFISTGWTGM